MADACEEVSGEIGTGVAVAAVEGAGARASHIGRGVGRPTVTGRSPTPEPCDLAASLAEGVAAHRAALARRLGHTGGGSSTSRRCRARLSRLTGAHRVEPRCPARRAAGRSAARHFARYRRRYTAAVRLDRPQSAELVQIAMRALQAVDLGCRGICLSRAETVVGLVSGDRPGASTFDGRGRYCGGRRSPSARRSSLGARDRLMSAWRVAWPMRQETGPAPRSGFVMSLRVFARDPEAI